MTAPPAPSGEPSETSGRWMLLVVALILAMTFPYLERLLNANERPRLLQGIAWVEGEGSVIDGPSTRGIHPGVDVSTTVDGRLAPNKPPGATVPAAAAYAMLRVTSSPEHPPTLRTYTWLARMLGGWLPTVALIVLAWRRYRLTLGSSVAAAAVTLYALATPAASYAHLLFGHQLTALFLWLGLTSLVDAGVTDRDAPFDRRRAIACAIAGGSLAAAVTVEYLAAFAALPVAAIMLFDLRTRAGRQRALATVAGGLPILAALATYHDTLFGSPFATGYHHVVDEGFRAKHGVGLLGLHRPTLQALYEHLVSPWGGLLYWAPILVLAALGCLPLLRRIDLPVRREAVLLLLSFAALLLVNLSLVQTGGWRVGPRYLVAASPLLILPLGLCLQDRTRSPILTFAWTVAIAWSATINLLAANLFPHLIPTGSPIGDILIPLWRNGHEPWSLVHLLGLDRGGLLLVTLLTLLVCGSALRTSLASARTPHTRYALAGLATATLALVATVLASPSSPLADIDLAAIEQAWAPTRNARSPSRPLW